MGIDACIAWSPFIALAVAMFKRFGFIRNNPKIVATILAAIIAAGHAWFNGALPSVAQLAACILQSLVGAVSTHEIALKPALAFLARGEARL